MRKASFYSMSFNHNINNKIKMLKKDIQNTSNCNLSLKINIIVLKPAKGDIFMKSKQSNIQQALKNQYTWVVISLLVLE